jgi:hypothetical protein
MLCERCYPSSQDHDKGPGPLFRLISPGSGRRHSDDAVNGAAVASFSELAFAAAQLRRAGDRGGRGSDDSGVGHAVSEEPFITQ